MYQGVLTVVTPPSVEPVDLGTAKLHVKQEENADDALLAADLQAAREAGERESGRAWLDQTLKLQLEAFPSESRPLVLPRPPVLTGGTLTVKYYDEDDVLQTVAGTVYELIPDRYRPMLVLRPDQEWPSDVRSGKAYPVEVQWQAGYGTTAGTVPAIYRKGVLLLLGHWYENREATLVGSIAQELPRSVTDCFAWDRVVPV